jgi:hypothetical protein
MGSQISGANVDHATKFSTVAPDICGSSEWNLLHITLLAHNSEIAPSADNLLTTVFKQK